MMFIARVDSTDKASFFLDKGKIVFCESVNESICPKFSINRKK